MATDRSSPSQPAQYATSVTPSDSGSIVHCRGLWIGGAGDITVNFRKGGTNITLVAVSAGSLLPIDVSRVYSTGTTATDIVALY